MVHRPILRFSFDLAAAPSRPPQLEEAEVLAAFGADSASHLGSGAFGETWRVVTGGDVQAVKVILEPEYPVARLRREAEGLARGACANVVRLDDVGRVSVGGADRAFFRCEFIEGGDAGQHLRAGRWPTADEQVEFCAGVLKGLAALHTAETVHRDVKFENVALRDGKWSTPVLLDLGLVRIEDQASLTMYPALMGTPAFMAPEQVRQHRARKASDLWALGTMMFVLATRRHPFYDAPPASVGVEEALRRMHEGPPDTSACPRAIRGLVERWLNPTVHRRGSTRRAVNELDL